MIRLLNGHRGDVIS